MNNQYFLLSSSSADSQPLEDRKKIKLISAHSELGVHINLLEKI
jgi:hypothetical protein